MTPPDRQRAARWAATVAVIAFAWMIYTWLGGGFDTLVFGVRIRANDPNRARVWGEIALAIYIWLRGPAHARAEFARIARTLRRFLPHPLLVPALPAAVVIVGGSKT